MDVGLLMVIKISCLERHLLPTLMKHLEELTVANSNMALLFQVANFAKTGQAPAGA